MISLGNFFTWAAHFKLLSEMISKVSLAPDPLEELRNFERGGGQESSSFKVM